MGRVLRRVGNLANKVLSPMSQIASSVAPAVAAMAPMAGPAAPALLAASTMGPALLKAGAGVGGVVGAEGAKLVANN